MPQTWFSIRESLTQRIAESGLTWDKLAEESGVPKPCLHRFCQHGRGLSTANTDRLLAYFNLIVTEAPATPRPRKKGR
jgi:plasmid maintenance system antidote protein VapI